MNNMNKYAAADFLTSFDSTDFLGRGSYASVRRCYHKELRNVVVKCYFVTGSDVGINRNFNHMHNEANVLCKIEHENIIKVFGITQWSTCYGLIMEEATGCNLEDLIIHEKHKDIPWPLRWKFFTQIAAGINYLHNHDPKRAYIHGDLKPQNILLDENLVVKIADFGAVSIIQASGASSASVNVLPCKQYTWLYSAPELLKNPEIKRTCAMDVYSYAMIGYEIITRQQVFVATGGVSCDLIRKLIMENGQKPNQDCIKQVQEKLADEIDLAIFNNLYQTIKQCWHLVPSDRISIQAIQLFLKKGQSCSEGKHLNLDNLKKSQMLSSKCSKRVPLQSFEFPFQTANEIRITEWNPSKSLTVLTQNSEDYLNEGMVRPQNLFPNSNFALFEKPGYSNSMKAPVFRPSQQNRSALSTPTGATNKTMSEAFYSSFQDLYDYKLTSSHLNQSSPLRTSVSKRSNHFDGLLRSKDSQFQLNSPASPTKSHFSHSPLFENSTQDFAEVSLKKPDNSGSPFFGKHFDFSAHSITRKNSARSSGWSHLSSHNNSIRERFEIYPNKTDYGRSLSVGMSPHKKQPHAFQDQQHLFSNGQFYSNTAGNFQKSPSSSSSPKKTGIFNSIKQTMKRIFKKNKPESTAKAPSQDNSLFDERKKSYPFLDTKKNKEINSKRLYLPEVFASTSNLMSESKKHQELDLKYPYSNFSFQQRSKSASSHRSFVEHSSSKLKLSLSSIYPRGNSIMKHPFHKINSSKPQHSSLSSYGGSNLSSKSSLFTEQPGHFRLGSTSTFDSSFSKSNNQDKIKFRPINKEDSSLDFTENQNLRKIIITPDQEQASSIFTEQTFLSELQTQFKNLKDLSFCVSPLDSRRLYHNCSGQCGIEQHEFLEEAKINCENSSEYFLRICLQLHRIHGENFNREMLLEHFTSKHGNQEIAQFILYYNSLISKTQRQLVLLLLPFSIPRL